MLELDLKDEWELQTLQESGPGLAGGRESLGAVIRRERMCLFIGRTRKAIEDVEGD